MKKLVLGITSPGSILLIEGQAKFFSDLGYQVYLMCPETEKVKKYCQSENCKHLKINIKRNISPFHDIVTFFQILIKLKKIKPDVINFGTPKISLLGITAARFVGVPKRIYTCRGLRYEHEKGIIKTTLILMEKITGFFSHKIICVGPSLLEKTQEDKLFPKSKVNLINKGSSNGVNLSRFNPLLIQKKEKELLKNELKIKESELVFGFVGRMVDRKGINELYNAFNNLTKKEKNIKLVLV